MSSRRPALAAVAALGALAVVGGACKTDDARRSPATRPGATAPEVRADDGPEVRADDGPALRDDDGPAPAAPPLTLARIEALAPALPGAVPLAPLRLFQVDQARATWCVSGEDAEVIAQGIARALRTAGWDEVTSRGTADRAGAAGTQDGLRASFSVGGRDPACPGGRVATAHFHGATVTLPAVTPGEPIR